MTEQASLVAQTSKKGACQRRRHWFDPYIGKITWRRAWQPTPVSCLENPHGQRSLAGDSPWGHTESDTTEALTLCTLMTRKSSDIR